ncbi:RtcB family protein [Candidatus Woesearchaeota archaeon]|nr:RtcB family protein [Candidatus Woesearchaeota archaeon]
MDINQLNKISDYEWEIPLTGDMKVPGRIFASKMLIEEMDDKVKEQISNVAALPGIQKASLAMPDAHWGYGFPIGGVGAFDPEEDGIISVGGVGFDINCGVRTLKTNLTVKEVQPKIKELVDSLFNTVPAGLGSRGEIALKENEINDVMTLGSKWIIEKGYGTEEDLEYTEENGYVEGADPKNVSDLAIRREKKQVGTLGSGNHYLEMQVVDEIFDEKIAKKFGLEKDQVIITLHCGSRALGHQIGSDYLKILADASRKYNIPIREKELVCAPINSPEGKKYYSAMVCGINYAFANRQVITHLTRQGFNKIFPDAELKMLYDIGHNTCKIEEHKVGNKVKKLYVHRKGSTRAFGPDRKDLPKAYSGVGQPVIIGGSMGTSSYILAGAIDGKASFESVCHGAGRSMSRTQAKKQWWGGNVVKELAAKGIIIKGHSMSGLAEEAPGAYKEVNEVIESVCKAKLANKVIRMRPIGNVKG